MQIFYDNVKPLTPFEPLWIRVLEFLKEAIVKGTIQAGEKLNESLIAAKLGVSRSPVREAIRVLESENFVETIDRRGTFVKPLSLKEIEEILTVLNFLQLAAIELAVENMDRGRKKELTAMTDQMEAQKNTTDINEYKSMSTQFHSFIIRASKNDLLIKIYESLLIQRERVMLWGASTEPIDISSIIDEHLLISRSFLKGDVKQTARLMKEHAKKARLRFNKALSK